MRREAPYRFCMRVLILTSKDHPYANALLLSLLQSGAFDGDELLVAEQDWVLPHKSSFVGVRKYASSAGWRYVFVQACKQYLFRFVRLINGILGRKSSSFFPYKKFHHPKMTARVLQDLTADATVKEIESFKPDVLLSLLSKEIIPERILSLSPKGCFNLHPAPLPRYRGVSPTFWVLAEGDKQAGCSLHRLDAGIDTGEIIARTLIPTAGISTEHALYMQCMGAGLPLVSDLLKKLRTGEPLGTQQLLETPTYFSLPTKEAIRSFYAKGNAFFRLSEFLH